VAVVEVETASLRVRVADPRLVTLSARPAEDHDPLWLPVYPGLWISPPSLRQPHVAPAEREPAPCLECCR
jgi:hypothetical protein